MMTTPERKPRNEWIHGGKYIKPSTPRLPQKDDCYDNDNDNDNDGASRRERTGPAVLPSCQLVTRARELIRWLYPVLECSVRTLIALFLTLIGAMVVGIAMLLRWKREHVAIAPIDPPNSEAAASLERRQLGTTDGRASVSPADDGATPPPLPMASNLSTQQTTTPTTTTTPATSMEQPPPKSAPPASAMRSRNVSTTTPRSARRVLFQETEQGEVSTTKIHYDKDLPASARKVRNSYERVIIDQSLFDSTKERTVTHATSATAAASALPPSPFIHHNATFTPTNHNPIAQVHEPNPVAPTMQNFSSIKNKSADDARFNIGAKLSPSYNPKRKRRELIGATSRWNRNHRARVVSNRSFTKHRSSTKFLSKSNTLKRRRDQQEMDQIDQWVWRAMNDVTEKENFNAVGGKRAKGSSAEGADELIVRSVMTPWKGSR